MNSKEYISANIAFILRNAQLRGLTAGELTNHLNDRLTDLHLEKVELSKEIVNARKIFRTEARYQGLRTEAGKEFKVLAKMDSYSFEQNTR